MGTREQKVTQWRIFEIDRLIREGNYPNATTFREQLGISRSTVNRDIEFLRTSYNAPIEFDSVKNGYYYTDKNFFIQNVMLSEGELFSLATVFPLFEQYRNTPLKDSFVDIMHKISDMLPKQVSVDSYFLNNEIFFIPDPLPKIEQSVFESVFKALRLHKSIQFQYKSVTDDEYKFRSLDPYHVICQKGNWYVIGFCHEKNEIRVFALFRMKDVVLENADYKIPKDFKLSEHIDSNFGIWVNNLPPQKIELLFEKSSATYVQERTWHPTQKIEVRDDGKIYLSFQTNQVEMVVQWILQFGGSVKVLGPQEVKERVMQAARKILQDE